MKNLLQETSKGNFRAVINYLLTNDVEMNSTTAINLMLSCCTVCTKNQCEIDYIALCELLQMCNHNMHELSDNQTDSYLRSMFYIIKHLLDKDNYLMVMKLKNCMLPNFIASVLTDQQKQTALAMSSIIYNKVAKQTVVDKYTFEISYISLKLLLQARLITIYAERAYNLLKIFHALHVDAAGIKEVYSNFLCILHSSECHALTKMSIKPFINILQPLITILISKQCLPDLRKLVQSTLVVLQKWYTTKEHVLLLKILRAFTELFTEVKEYHSANYNLTKTMSECYSNLKLLIQLYSQEKQESIIECLVVGCEIIYFILYKLSFNCYQEVDADVWKKGMPPEVQVLIYKILHTSAVFVEKLEKPCSYCTEKECKIHTALYKSVNYCITPMLIYKQSIRKDVFSKNMTSEILARTARSCNIVIKLKDNECSSWKDAWKELGGVLYNIGFAFYKKKEMECVPFMHLLIENLIKLEGTTSSIISETIYESSLLCLKEMYLHSKQYARAMAVAAVVVVSCCGNRDSALSEWLRIKLASSERDTDEKEVTIIDALQRDIEYVKQIYPFEIETCVKVDLLISELHFYKEHWSSKAAMKTALKKLYELGDCLTVAKLAVQIWALQKPTQEELVSEIIEKICGQVEQLDEPMENKGIVLAGMYFCHYRTKRQRLVMENKEEMKSSPIIPLKPWVSPEDLPIPVNDECDIVTVYEKLNFRTQIKLMKLLDKAVVTFEGVLNFSNPELDIDVLGILYEIAYEYHLHFNRINCLRTWLLILSYAKKTKNTFAILKSISWIIDFSDISLDSVKQLLPDADTALKKLKEDKTVENIECIINFHISKSFAYLRIENLQAAVDEFHQAQEVNALAELPKYCLAAARLYCLEAKFLMLPCRLQVIAHNAVPGVKLYQAFKILKILCEDNSYSNLSHIAYMFDFGKTMNDLYRWMHLPRELRCYNSDIILVAQQFLLPYRVAHCLVLLAHADIMSLRLDDFQVKINGLANVLCLETHNLTAGYKKQAKLDNDECDYALAAAFDEISLSAQVQKDRILSGSPTLPVQQFKLPGFVKHRVDCDCYYCTSVEYHELVMMKIYFDALSHLHKNKAFSNSFHCFSGVVQMHNSFKRKICCVVDKYNKIFGGEYLRNFDSLYHEAMGNTLLDYAKALFSVDRRMEAVKINEDLYQMVESRKLQNVFLYNEAVFQKITLMWSSLHKASVTKIGSDENDEADANNIAECKTPESNITKISFKKSLSPNCASTYNKTIKPIPFNLDDAENVAVSQIHKASKPKTCLPPSIRVDICESKTTTKKKKAISQTIKNHSLVSTSKASSSKLSPVLQEKTNLPTRKNKKRVSVETEDTTEIDDTICDSQKSSRQQSVASCISPNPSTPESTQLSPLEKTIRKNTRLLKEKIKKPVCVEIDSSCDVVENSIDSVNDTVYSELKKSTRLQALARKNLAHELSICEDVGKKNDLLVKKDCHNTKKAATRGGRISKKKVM